LVGTRESSTVRRDGDVRETSQKMITLHRNGTYTWNSFSDYYDYDGGYDPGGFTSLGKYSGHWRISSLLCK
jgi:hypothetical protein